MSGETETRESGSFRSGEVPGVLGPSPCWRSCTGWEWAESGPDSEESWARSRQLLAAPPVQGCWAGAFEYTSSGEGEGRELSWELSWETPASSLDLFANEKDFENENIKIAQVEKE